MNLFLVDTAAEITAFDIRLRHLLGRRVRTVDLAAPGSELRSQVTFVAPECKMDKLQLSFGDSVALVDLQGAQCVSGHKIEGVLGMDVLKQYVVRIDFDAGKLSILKGIDSRDKTLGVFIPINYRKKQTPNIVAAASTEHVSEFIVDTGATSTAILRSNAFDELVLAGKIQKLKERNRQTVIGVSRVFVGRNEVLAIHGFQVWNPIVCSGDMNYLGLGFWSRFVITFDFPGKGLYLLKGKRFKEHDQVDQSGLHLLRKDGKVLVHSVDEGSPAAISKIKARDTIVSINGEAQDQVSMFDLRRRLCSYSKPLNMKISRGNEQIDVALAPAERLPSEQQAKPTQK